MHQPGETDAVVVISGGGRLAPVLLDPLGSAQEAGKGFLALGSLVRSSLGCVGADFRAQGQVLAQ